MITTIQATASGLPIGEGLCDGSHGFTDVHGWSYVFTTKDVGYYHDRILSFTAKHTGSYSVDFIYDLSTYVVIVRIAKCILGN